MIFFIHKIILNVDGDSLGTNNMLHTFPMWNNQVIRTYLFDPNYD